MLAETYKGRDLDSLKADESALLAVLKSLGAKVINPRKISCYAHDDNHPSAGVYPAKSGKSVRYSCRSCGINKSIIDVLAEADNITDKEVLEVLYPKAEPKQYTMTLEELKAEMPAPVVAIEDYPDGLLSILTLFTVMNSVNQTLKESGLNFKPGSWIRTDSLLSR
jgi:hypothetical protein